MFKLPWITIALSLLSTICAITVNRRSGPAVTGLQCEYLINPLGVDTPHPRFKWILDDDRPGSAQQGYRLWVGTDSATVAVGHGKMWQTGVLTSDQELVRYEGRRLQPFTRYYWKVTLKEMSGNTVQSPVASFETGMMDVANWKGDWISDDKTIQEKAAPYFRHDFRVKKQIVSARAYIAAAGLFELYVNGKKIGDHRLDPMYTRFDRRILYLTHDLTTVLQRGGNTIGVLLGNGWYNFQSLGVWNFERAPWRNRPAFCMDIHITYSDGSSEIISSDKNWKTSTGPLIYNSIYTGEQYDATLEQPGWNRRGFDESHWRNVNIRQAPSRLITAQTTIPIRAVERILPISIKRLSDSSYLVDFGRNISGVTELKLDGFANTVVKVIHAERLKNGLPDQSNVDYFLAEATRADDPFGTDVYKLNGRGPEIITPHFNYKGFQYVQVKANKPITLNSGSICAWFMHSDVKPVGSIYSSNQLLNKIWAATNASYLSNLFGYPTDCPQREKNGWTGDAHIASEVGLYNFDAITVYEKWLADHRDEQQPNGVLPAIIPTDGWGYSRFNGIEWTSTIAIIPWNVYLFYGDTKILRDNYDNIKRYINHINELYPSGLTDWGLGDWAPVKTKTPVEFGASVYYFTDATILAKTAKILGNQADYKIYSALGQRIKNAINHKYLDLNTGKYGQGTQTEQSLALYWGLTPGYLKFKTAQLLADSVTANHDHLDTGILGAKAILGALSDNGQAETAYRLATQTTFPSWGWWIMNGATTLYENWDITRQRDLSLNHIMFGEIGAWMYKTLGGVRIIESAPGFKRILLQAHFISSLGHFKVTHKGPYGNIISSWTRVDRKINYEVTIPANSSAVIKPDLPAGTKIYENDKPLTQEIEKKAGHYYFTIQ